MKLIRPTLLMTALAVAMLFIAACSSDPTPTPTSPPPTATAAPTVAPGEPTPTAAPPTPTPARDMEAYFTGVNVKIAVGFSPGGGYDAFARLFAKFGPRHFPGTPKFVVRNMDGGGGERVFKNIYGKVDGYSVAVSHPRFYKRELLGTDVEYFDINKVNILGTPDASAITQAYFVNRTFAMTYDQAVAEGKTMTTGATAIGDSGGVGSAFMELLGAPVKVIYAYGGTSEIAAAFDRNELTGSDRGGYQNAPTLFPEWVAEKRIVPLFRWGAEPEDDPAWVAYMSTLDTVSPPHVFDILNPTDGEKAVFRLTETVNDSLSRTFILPEGVPQDIVDVWVKGFADTINDPDFQAAAALLGRSVQYGGPESIIEALALGKEALKDPALAKLFGELAGAE